MSSDCSTKLSMFSVYRQFLTGSGKNSYQKLGKTYFVQNMLSVAIFLLFLTAPIYMQNEAETFEEDKYGVKYASDCEVCKVVAIEFQVG